MDILAVPRALKAQGFDPGPLDGIWGRLTAAAVKAFQRKNGLPVGLLTPETERAILTNAPAQLQQTGLVWYDEAIRLMGTAERPGPANNPVVLDWAEDLDIAYGDDDIPWCGLFTAHCIGSMLQDEALPNGPLGARNWLKFGRQSRPALGAVLVFWRVARDSWQGHVGFYAGEDNDTLKVLGGNQSNRVSYARISKSRLLGARWPKTASAVGYGPIVDDLGGMATGGSEA